MGPLLTLFSNPLPTPLLTRPLKNYFYRHFGVFEVAIGPAPHSPKSPGRVRPRVSKESKKSPKVRFWTLFGLFRDSGVHSFGTFGALPRGTLSGLFSGPKDSGDPVWGAGPNCNSERKSPFASEFFDRKEIAHLGAIKIARLWGSGKNRHRNRRESCSSLTSLTQGSGN